jgi:quercetin 2,3-dioxygenase
MSGPVGTVDAPPTDARASAVKPACVEITPSRESVVGAMRVRRALPRIGRRTVGAWCFADHMGPELVTETSGLDIGPTPTPACTPSPGWSPARSCTATAWAASRSSGPGSST